MTPLRLFLLGLALIAFLATLYTQPKTIGLTYTTLADESPQGHSILYTVLSHGHPLASSASELPQGKPVVAVVAEPTVCSTSALQELLSQLQGHRGRTGLVLSAPPSCVNRFLDLVGSTDSFKGELRAALAVDIDTGTLVALVGAGLTHVAGGEAALLLVAPRPGTYSPGLPATGLRLHIGRVDTVVIAAREAFTNEVLVAASRTGLGNTEYIKSLVERLGGRNATVYLPTTFYLKHGFLLTIHPARLTAMLAQWLHGVEQSILAAVMSSPPLALAAATILAAAVYSAIALASGGLGTPVPEEPAKLSPTRPLEALGATSILLRLSGRDKPPRLSRSEAKYTIYNLYRLVDEVLRSRLGVGVEDVARSPERLQELAGLDPAARRRAIWALRRLHTLYTKKIERRERLPIVLSWRRELTRMLEAIDPLLDALGASLKTKRGVERVLLR